MEALIKEKMLVRTFVTLKGKFRRQVEYLVPCSAAEVRKKKNVTIKMAKTKKQVLPVNLPQKK